MQRPGVISIDVSGEMSKRIKRDKIHFEPGINIIIGPNGSGKSSIFELLLNPSEENKKNCKVDSIVGTFFKFDFEKDNPRKKSHFKSFANVISRFASHGQSNIKVIELIDSDKVENKMVFMDEPEQALDIYNMTKLVDILHRTKAAQINIITHHPFLILNDFHIIEIEDGYYDSVIQFMTPICERLKRNGI
jgi:predicted ATPase